MINKRWETLSSGAVLNQLATRPEGLTKAEAAKRLIEFGPNLLHEAKPPGVFTAFAHQFRSPLIYILILAALLSTLIGNFTDAAFIGAVLIINAVIGSFQEWRAEKSAQALQKLLRARATAIRDDDPASLDAIELVPGDVISVESGDHVPADIRLLTSHGLQVDESTLTGESTPTEKNHAWISKDQAPVTDHRNMLHAGSVVARGRGTGVVVETGNRTELGRVAEETTTAHRVRPPLIIRMERFTRQLALAVLCAVVLMIGLGLMRGFPLSEVVIAGIALAVAAIPEGLPVALTVALAIATTKMVRRNVIVRRLAAVEGLGSCTMILSDKTGTLTVNELTVREIRLPNGQFFSVTGEGFIPDGKILFYDQPIVATEFAELAALLASVTLNNEGSLRHINNGWKWRGDPADIALLTLAAKAGLNRENLLKHSPQTDAVPFEPELRFSATFHAHTKGSVVYIKGAPEKLWELCANVSETSASKWRRWVNEMAGRGLRVLAVAQKRHTESIANHSKIPAGLEFLGLVGMIDPLRPEAKEAVQRARAAGVVTCMLTGDHPETAFAIANELGIAKSREEMVTGLELQKFDTATLSTCLQKTRVFARITPEQKLEIVRAARMAGHFVAVTGDGVNDAPALKSANIGIAMGITGTDVARQAADLVLRDDNFSSIVNGIEEGRIAYDNIRKVIFLLISTGATEIVLVMLSLILGLPIPLSAVQLLWLNLVTNGIQDVALATEPGEGDVLERKPRSTNERIFDRIMIEKTLLTAGIIGTLGTLIFGGLLKEGWSEFSARNALLLFMVLFENIHIGNCRSETKSVFKLSPFKSPFLLFATVTAQLVHVASMHIPPMQLLLEVEPVSIQIWCSLLAAAMSIMLAMEIYKHRLRLPDRLRPYAVHDDKRASTSHRQGRTKNSQDS